MVRAFLADQRSGYGHRTSHENTHADSPNARGTHSDGSTLASQADEWTVRVLDCDVVTLYHELAAATEDSSSAPTLLQIAEAHDTGRETLVTREELLSPVLPGKIICVGLNYAAHIAEMGHPTPSRPTLFAKFPDALCAPFATVDVPRDEAAALDYEAELTVVIGRRAERVSEADAVNHIAGWTIMNDFSQRDRQYATEQWLQGKTLTASSAIGPWILLADGAGSPSTHEGQSVWGDRGDGNPGGRLRSWVNGEARQDTALHDLVFSPAKLVSYISQFVRLNPGDIIATGTPAGVGHGMNPKQYLSDGDTISMEISAIGHIESQIRIVDK